MGDGEERVCERVMEDSSVAVGARRTIFLDVRIVRGVAGKGGLSMPGLGVIMNFWCMGGMERVVSM